MTATYPPVRYSASVETPEPDEDQSAAGIRETLHGIEETTAKDYGRAVRSVHAKAHGIVEGKLAVLDGLPPELAQGLFAAPGSYDAVLRFSTNPGDILDDSVSLPRGLAVKLLGVAGERLPGSESDTTQDFVMVDGPAFMAPTTKAFLANLKQLAPTTDRAEWAKKLLSGVLRVAEGALETVGLESAKLTTLGGHGNTHPLGATYYSQTPFRYGNHIAKFSIAPVSDNLTALAKETINPIGRPDALREALDESFVESDSSWELRVQLCTDLDKMPVEDATVAWDEKASPYVAVARLTVAAQRSWEHGVSERRDDALSFSPWHGLAAHRPLGSINRARQQAYVESAEFRARFNGCPIHQPRKLAELDA